MYTQARQWIGMFKLVNEQAASPYSLESYSGNLPAQLRVAVILSFSYYSYCASVYVRVVSQHGVKVSLWASKCRLAPSKSYTIPNLEWMSCLLLSKLTVIAKEVVECEVDLSGVLLIRQ